MLRTRTLGLALVLGLAGAAPALGGEGDEGCHKLQMEVWCSVSSGVVFVGDPFTATASVRNTGDLALHDVTLAMGGGDGVMRVGDAPLKLEIPRLEPGETREIRASFTSDEIGERRVHAHARDSQGWASAGCFCGILLKGLPAIQMVMVDLDRERNPAGIFEVGDEFIYDLLIENDAGTALTPDLKIVWSLPPELEFVSGAGERGTTVAGQKQAAESSSFVLAPNQKMRFEIVVRVIGVPRRNLTQTRAAVFSVADGVELGIASESTTLKARAGEGR